MIAVVLAVVLSNLTGGPAKGGEVFLEAANETGQDAYTDSANTTAAKDHSVPPLTTSPAAATGPTTEVRGVDGGSDGLYSGRRDVSSCDVEKEIRTLHASPSKNRSFAKTVGVRPDAVPAYLRSLTPVQLRADTRVTFHGYRDGSGTERQAVLQTGTAVLVDGHGMPRVRCACTNPLSAPVAQRGTPQMKGKAWSAYRPSNVVVVTPAPRAVHTFVLYDARHDNWFQRQRGDNTGHTDQLAQPPPNWVDPVKPPREKPQGACVSPGATQTPGAPTAPCPGSPSPSSSSPSSTSPSSSSPGSKPPSSESPSSGKPSSEKPSSEKPSSEKPSSEKPSSEKPSSEKPSSEKPSSESPSSEKPSSEAPKSEAPKSEAPKSEAPKSEAPKSEAPKTEGPPSSAGPASSEKVTSGPPASEPGTSRSAPSQPSAPASPPSVVQS
ncbi:DUF6777 domain-containing protein [Streptomyces sp. NPDC046805]|uniref:DUF6777 domain-containing protein n=1 Tax=Streptomyces sp. NPDC046805 TaxID=3155134 RepID=UPI003401B5AD